MADAFQRQGALDFRGLQAAAHKSGECATTLSMWVAPPCGQLCLRGKASEGFAGRVESVWSVPLPLTANTVNVAADPIEDKESHARRILWLGPDEWLAVCAEDEIEWLHRA